MKKVIEKFIRKNLWLTKKNTEDLEKEAKKKNISESALMRHIITNWFEK